jgi:hypothetical protein
MRRRLLNLLTALSLLLCVAVCVLWVWSYAATPAVFHQRPGRTSGVMAYRGRLLFETAGRHDTPVWPGLRGLATVRVASPPSERLYLDASQLRPAPVLGFQGYFRTSATARMSAVTVPLWVVAVLILLPPGIGQARRYVQRRWRRRGLCASCGYDLRATPGRCPECGTVTSAASNSPGSPPSG